MTRKIEKQRAGAKPKRKVPRRQIANVEILKLGSPVAVQRHAGTVGVVEFGTIVGLDYVAVQIDGEVHPRAYAPREVRLVRDGAE